MFSTELLLIYINVQEESHISHLTIPMECQVDNSREKTQLDS